MTLEHLIYARWGKSTPLNWLLIILSVASCSRSGWRPERRPAGVEKGAVWAGGPDGGSYILCGVDRDRNVNLCKVWNDYTGEIVERGCYRLVKEVRAATERELTYRWADRAGWIGLKDGLIL